MGNAHSVASSDARRAQERERARALLEVHAKQPYAYTTAVGNWFVNARCIPGHLTMKLEDCLVLVDPLG